MDKYERHREIERQQAHTQLCNAALLLTYQYGLPGGWLAVCHGHIDGFRNDYYLIHSNPGNIECHQVREFLVGGNETALEELEDIRQLVAQDGELPPVTRITEEHLTHAKAAFNEALADRDDDPAEYLRQLCNDGTSDVSYADFDSVIAHL